MTSLIAAKSVTLSDPDLVNRLACPACLGGLSLASSENAKWLVCALCRRAYPLVDGIPVLIAERAQQFAQ